MTVAEGAPGGWRVAAPVPVGDPGTLFDRLRALGGGAPVLLGVDFPIGVPRGYAAQCAEPDFPTFLRGLAGRPRFFEVCATLDEVGLDRPFYPARPAAGMTRAAHAAALGLADGAALNRACDRATGLRPAGAPVFWTLGANQSGKAALHGWRHLLLPARGVALWPFEGTVASLLAAGRVVVAETYPAEALRQLGLRMGGSKRRQGDRARLAPALLAAMRRLAALPEAALVTAVEDGFGGDAAGEDRFDCGLGVLCVLTVLAGGQPDVVPNDPWVWRWEGWVLGQRVGQTAD